MILTRSVILSPVSAASLVHPRIGYHNLFRSGTVIASSEDDDHPAALAYDGLTYDGWRPTSGGEQWIEVDLGQSEEADYMAIAAHTLAGCELTPQYMDEGSEWIDAADTFQPSNNGPVVWEFENKIQANAWRLLIEDAPNVFSLGAINVGERLTLQRGFPVGWAPPSLNEQIAYTNTISEGGQILGRHVVRRGAGLSGSQANVTHEWARDAWKAFTDAAERYPFFFWRVIGGETEILYGGLVEKGAQTSTRRGHVTASFSMQGIAE